MPALKAHAQVHPLVAGLEAIFATLCGWLDGFDVVFDMPAGWFRHEDSP